MRILILTTAYGPGRTHAPLIETLSDAMAAEGHQVRVAGVDWDAEPGSGEQHYIESDGVEVLLTPPVRVTGLGRIGGLLGKWIFSATAALPVVRRTFGDVEYDLMFVMTPAVTLRALLLWGRRRSRHSYAYITDFFPIQHASAGLLPTRWLKQVAQLAETRLLRKFDTLGTMSPLGVRFLRDRFSLRPSQPIETLYLWTENDRHHPRPRDDVRRQYGLPLDKSVVVFGGQITHGRGVEDILSAASLAASERPDVRFLFVGDGPLRPLIDNYIADGGDNMLWLGALPRTEYLDVVASCDIGLVATIATHDSPNFPSKTLDYLKARLPIVASVGGETDYDEFVVGRGFGLAVRAGDVGSMVRAISEIMTDSARAQKMRDAGSATLTDVFSARHAARQILRSSSLCSDESLAVEEHVAGHDPSGKRIALTGGSTGTV